MGAGASDPVTSATNLPTAKSPDAVLRTTPFSVMIPAMSAAGVTSNDGFQTSMPSAATRFPRLWVISVAGLSSMTISAPFAVDGSRVLTGAATKNGTSWYAAETARL